MSVYRTPAEIADDIEPAPVEREPFDWRKWRRRIAKTVLALGAEGLVAGIALSAAHDSAAQGGDGSIVSALIVAHVLAAAVVLVIWAGIVLLGEI